MMKKNRKTVSTYYWKIIGTLLFIIIVFQLAACSTSFCDAYTDTVYEKLADILGKASAIIPVVIGELLMYLGILLVLLAILFAFLLIFFGKKQQYCSFVKRYMKGMLCIVVLILLVYTFHWVIPFRSSLLGKTDHDEQRYTEEQLRILRTFIVENLNEVSGQVERDEEGHIRYKDIDTTNQAVAAAMQSISDQYPRLKGYYPSMKAAGCSEILEFMRIGGYTYPYTMEITYNRYTDPSLFAHESAHPQGYYKENEANFLSYLACIQSDDPILRYSGYLTIYFYIDDTYTNVMTELHDDTLWEEYNRVQVIDQVWIDQFESTEASNAEFENDEHPFESFSEIAEKTADVGWETQGELLQENGYDGVVALLLEYYDGILYGTEQAERNVPEDVPEYTGSPYIVIHDNIPAFSEHDQQLTEAFEFYRELDALGRCGQAYANICPELQPTEERGEIGEIKPSGWHTVKYNEIIDGNYLYNRCHLIGYQLAGENANEKNLITGTRYLNVEGMLPFENEVNDYVVSTGNHVLYRVTPVFEGNNLVASGVQMEAWSVEDHGTGICFHVYCYNVQPGIEIDYATGESRVSKDSAVANTVSDREEMEFVVNTNTHKFHLPTCSSVDDIADRNKSNYTGTAQELIDQGYQPCQRCLGSLYR